MGNEATRRRRGERRREVVLEEEALSGRRLDREGSGGDFWKVVEERK